MRQNENLTICALSITAVVLLVGLILTTVGGQNQVMAIGQTARGGDYIVATGQFTQNSELVYVMDVAARRLNAYSYDKSRRQLVLWDGLDLSPVLGKAVP